MKLSFSTKGWHNSTFDDFCDIANDLKFQGIELHNIHNRLFTEKDGAFHDYAAAKTVRKLYEKKLSIPCIDTICNLADVSAENESIEEIEKCNSLLPEFCILHEIGHYMFLEEKKNKQMAFIHWIVAYNVHCLATYDKW